MTDPNGNACPAATGQAQTDGNEAIGKTLYKKNDTIIPQLAQLVSDLGMTQGDLTEGGNPTHETFVALFPLRGTATKMYTKGAGGGITKYPVKIGKYFRAEQYEIQNLSEFLNILAMLQDEDCFIIRGIPIDGVDFDQVVRKKNGEGATFKDAPKHIIPLDFDNVESPEHVDALRYPEAAVRWLIKEKLPTSFHGKDCVYQFSSSFGMENEGRQGRYLKLHLFFWTKEPLTEAQLRRWGGEYNRLRGEIIVDCAVFGTVQPVFVSRRRCLGFTDPAPQPMGFLKGEHP